MKQRSEAKQQGRGNLIGPPGPRHPATPAGGGDVRWPAPRVYGLGGAPGEGPARRPWVAPAQRPMRADASSGGAGPPASMAAGGTDPWPPGCAGWARTARYGRRLVQRTHAQRPRFYGGPGGMGPVLAEPQGRYAVCGARRTTPTPDPATRPAARSSRAISPRCPDGPGKRPREGRGLRRRCPCAAHGTPSPRFAGFRGSRRNPIILMRPLRTGGRRVGRGRDPSLPPTRTPRGSGTPGPGRRASRRRPRPRPAGRARGSPGRAGRPGGSRRHRRRGR